MKHEQARQGLGARLREIRKDARLSGRGLAALAGWHPSTVTRIELGKRGLSEEALRAWCTHCGAQDQIPDLIAVLRGISEAYVEWRRQLRTGLRRRQEASTPYYEQASLVRTYQPGIPPALLQTEDYARAILRARQRFRNLPDDVEEAVAARMARQRVLYTGDRRFFVVLEEQALLTRLGTRETMIGQLERLLDVTRMQHVSLGVIPARAQRTLGGPREGFVMFDNNMVQVETASAQLTITQPTEIAVYERTFEMMRAVAVCGDAARGLIRAAIAEVAI